METEKIELWRIAVLIFLLSVSFYSFVKFLPIEFTILDKDFFLECCSNISCKLNSTCDIYLKNWITKSNFSRTLIDDCCYWYGRYNENILSYCNPICLKLNKQ